MSHRVRAAKRPAYGMGGVPDECIESITGRHAVDRLGFQIGEIVYLRAVVVDAFIAEGSDATIKTIIIDLEEDAGGRVIKTDQTVRIEPERVIRAPGRGDAGPSQGDPGCD